MVKKSIAVLLALLLGLSVLAACQEENYQKTEAPETTSAQTSSETESETAGPAEDSEPEQTEITAEDYSYGLLDNGFINGVKASDYIEVPDFSQISFSAAEIEPDPSEVEEQITSFLSQYPEKITDRAIEDGDRVNIDYSGSMDGVKFDGGTAQGANVTAGSNEFIDDFLTQIIGHKPGETMDVEVTFPDPYQNNPDFAGKDAVFEVMINYIHGETPELTDEWVSENLEKVQTYFVTEKVTTAQELRDFIHDYYYNYNLDSKVYEYLAEHVTAEEIPETAMEIAKKRMDISIYSYYGVSTADFISYGFATEEDIEDSCRVDASMILLYQAIAEQEGWTDITEADFEELTGKAENQSFIDIYGKGYIAQNLIMQRAFEHINELVVIEEAETE